MLEEISFNPQVLAADFIVRPFTTGDIFPAASGLALPGNSNRVAVAFFLSVTAGVYWVAPFEAVAPNNGWQVNSALASSHAEFLYRDWGAMVGRDWFIFMVGGPSVVNGIEVIFLPEK